MMALGFVLEEAWNRINIRRPLKFKLDRKSLATIYTAFIRPDPEGRGEGARDPGPPFLKNHKNIFF